MSEVKKICIVCGQEKYINLFYLRKDTGKYKNTCLECETIRKKKYYMDNRNYLIDKQKEYKLVHMVEIKEYQDNYNAINSKKKKKYKIDNKESILINNRIYYNYKYNVDPTFRLRSIVSKVVYKALKKTGANKNGGSIVRCLPYSIQELKDHIETQFEPWMNWDNQGTYIPKKWDDNNVPTWTWQIDHIVPQSDLPYSSMQDDNFQKCWALSNLRPLSSKQNLMDGVERIRHGSTGKKAS